jgi:hypothetical protein
MLMGMTPPTWGDLPPPGPEAQPANGNAADMPSAEE